MITNEDVGSFSNEDKSQHLAQARRPRVWTVFVALLVGLVAVVGIQVVIAAAIVASQIAQGADPQQAAEDLLDTLMTPGAFIGLNLVTQLAIGKGGD